MARRKVERENIRKIQQSKGTYYVTIPIKIMRRLKWKERQKVVVDEARGRISIVDWKP